jgi:hypothetical protein
MAGPHAPAVALADPLMLNPMPSGPGRFPMARHPLVTISHPTPISAQPDVAGYRRHPDHFFTGRRRRNHYDAARGVPLVGDYDAPGECRSDY